MSDAKESIEMEQNHVNENKIPEIEMVDSQENQQHKIDYSEKYQLQANLLLLSNEQKQIALNKATGEVKLKIYSEINSGIDERIHQLQQKVAEKEELAKQLSNNLCLESYETQQLKEQHINNQEIIHTLTEAYENLVKRTKSVKNNMNDVERSIIEVKALTKKKGEYQTQLAELKLHNKQNNKINNDLQQENVQLRQQIATIIKEMNHLDRQTEHTKMLIANIETHKESLNKLELEENSLTRRLEEKKKLVEEHKANVVSQKQAFNSRLNCLTDQVKNLTEKEQFMLNNLEEKNSILMNLRKQNNILKEELDNLKDNYEKTSEVFKSQDQTCRANLELSKNELLTAENEYEHKIKTKKNIKEEIKLLKEQHINTLTEKHAATVHNLKMENLLLNKKNALEKAERDVEIITTKLQKAQSQLTECKSKTETIDAQLLEKQGMVKQLKINFEEEVKQLAIDHAASKADKENHLKVLEHSKMYLDEKIKNNSSTLNQLKLNINEVVEKNQLNQILHQSKQRDLEYIKNKLKTSTDYLNKLKTKRLPATILNMSTGADKPVGILKSPKGFKKPKLTPKKVKFEGYPSFDSFIDKADDGPKTPGSSQEDFFDNLVLNPDLNKNLDSSGMRVKKRKLDF